MSTTEKELIDLLMLEIKSTNGRLNGPTEGGNFQRNEGIRIAIEVVQSYFRGKKDLSEPEHMTPESLAQQERETILP